MTDLVQDGRQIVITGLRQAAVIGMRPLHPADDEIVVRNDATLVSPGTELALFEGTHAGLPDPEVTFAKYPFYPGYAALGTVIEIGKNAQCAMMGRRIFHFGRHARFSTLRPDRAVWIEVPEGFLPEQILLLRLVQIAATATHVWRRRPSRVLILGAGIVGILAAQICRIKNVPEIAIQDINPARLALAARCGIPNGLLATDNNVPARNDLFGGAPPDCIIEATGVTTLAVSALKGIRRGGDVILLGSPRGPAQIDLYKLVHHKGAALIGAHEALWPDRDEGGGPSRQKGILDALGWLRAGAITLDGLVSHAITPEELPEIYARMAADKTGFLGALVRWQ